MTTHPLRRQLALRRNLASPRKTGGLAATTRLMAAECAVLGLAVLAIAGILGLRAFLALPN